MIPASFDYEVADSAAHALALLAEHGEDAKLLAGGHSLLPMMKVRLAQPAVLIDIARVTELSGIAHRRRRGGHRRDHQARRRGRVRAAQGRGADPRLRGRAGRRPADPPPRHDRRLARARRPVRRPADDPARARRLRRDHRARPAIRLVGADDFFTGPFESVLGPDELLTAVRVPRGGCGRPWGYQKFVRRANDWAIVGVAAYGGRVALASMGGTPLRALGHRGGAEVRRVGRRRRRSSRPRAPRPATTSTPTSTTASTSPAS